MDVRSIDFLDPDAGEAFIASLRETGFAVVKHAPIPWHALERIYAGWLDYFLSDAKYEFLCDPTTPEGTQRGFVPIDVSETAVGHEHPDLKEFFHIRPGSDVPAHLADDIEAYRASAFTLGVALMDWIKQYAPPAATVRLEQTPDTVRLEPTPATVRLEQTPDSILCPQTSLLRVVHYPPIDRSGEAERAAAHEDINLLTLLPASPQRGLELQTIQGAWVPVEIEPRDMVVNTGDMLQEATDRYFPSTTHRVVNPSANDNVSRISLPYFLAPPIDTVLSSRYTAGGYLAERLAEINR